MMRQLFVFGSLALRVHAFHVSSYDFHIRNCPVDEHHSFDFLFLSCHNDTHMSTVRGTCHKDGTKSQTVVNTACPDDLPYCLHCGLTHVCSKTDPSSLPANHHMGSPICQDAKVPKCGDGGDYSAGSLTCSNTETFAFHENECQNGVISLTNASAKCGDENPNRPYCYSCKGRSICSSRENALDCDHILKGTPTPTTNTEDNFDSEVNAPNNPGHPVNQGSQNQENTQNHQNNQHNHQHNNHHNNQHHNNKHNHHNDHHSSKHKKHKFRKFLKVTALLVVIGVLAFIAYKAIVKRRNKNKVTAKDILDKNYNENLQNAVKEMEASDPYYDNNGYGGDNSNSNNDNDDEDDNKTVEVEEFEGDEAPRDEEKGNSNGNGGVMT